MKIVDVSSVRRSYEHSTYWFYRSGTYRRFHCQSVKKNTPDIRITAYDVNTDTLKLAEEEGIADATTSQINEAFSDCDYIFLCAPVQKMTPIFWPLKI